MQKNCDSQYFSENKNSGLRKKAEILQKVGLYEKYLHNEILVQFSHLDICWEFWRIENLVLMLEEWNKSFKM